MPADPRARRCIGLAALYGPVVLFLAIVLGPALIHLVLLILWWLAFVHAVVAATAVVGDGLLGGDGWLSFHTIRAVIAAELRAARWIYQHAAPPVRERQHVVAERHITPPVAALQTLVSPTPRVVPEAFALRREQRTGTITEVYGNYQKSAKACIDAAWMALVNPAPGGTTLAIVHNNTAIVTVRFRGSGVTTVDTGRGDWALVGNYHRVCQQLGDILRALGDVRGFTDGVGSERG